MDIIIKILINIAADENSVIVSFAESGIYGVPDYYSNFQFTYLWTLYFILHKIASLFTDLIFLPIFYHLAFYLLEKIITCISM